jgi:hypothetical protein
MYVNGRHIRKDGQPMVLMIDDDWSTNDLPTVTSCDAAQAILSQAIAKIESDLARAIKQAENGPFDAAWFKRARAAMKMKRAAMRVVQERREQLLREEAQATPA